MQIFGRLLEISNSLERYLALKRDFYNLAESVRGDVSNRLSNEDIRSLITSCDTGEIAANISSWGCRVGREALDGVVNLGVGILIKNGIHSVDASAYESEYLDLSPIEECMDSGIVITRIQEIDGVEISRDCRRENRSAHARNMWRGGTLGGGVKGALKGALTAEFMNVAGGVLSDVAGKVGRQRTRSKMQEEIEKLLPLFCFELSLAIRDSVRASYDGYVRCLNEHLGVGFDGEWPEMDEKIAEGILGNLRDGRVPVSQQKEVAARMLIANPFNSEAYDWIYKNIKGTQREIRRLAAYFCVSVDAIEEAEEEKRAKTKQRADKRRAERKKVRAEAEARRTVFGVVCATLKEAERMRCDEEAFWKALEKLFATYEGQDGFAGNRLTAKKIIKISAVYNLLPNERVLWMIDTSNWYTASYGLVVTNRGFRWKNRDSELSHRRAISWKEFGELPGNLHIEDEDRLKLAEDAIVDMDINAKWAQNWMPVLEQARTYWRSGTFEKVDIEMRDTAMSSGSSDSKMETRVDMIRGVLEAEGSGLYCVPDIPEKKLINAKIAMAVPRGEQVVALMDTTFWGSAKNGAVLTVWGIRWKNDWTIDSKMSAMSWEQIAMAKDIQVKDTMLRITNDAVLTTAGSGISAEKFKKILLCVAEHVR